MIQCHSRFNLQIETWIEILGCSIANRLRVHASASSNFISSGTHPQLPLKGRTSGHTHPAESECQIRPARNPPQRPQRRVFHIHTGTRSRCFGPIGESALCCTVRLKNMHNAFRSASSALAVAAPRGLQNAVQTRQFAPNGREIDVHARFHQTG